MTKRLNYTLWTLQVMLAILFLFAGSMKLVLPLAAMSGPLALPGWFLRFLGVAEVAGGLGLVLPGLLGIRRNLTAWAAAGLLVIMIGAVSISATTMGVGAAIVPLAAGIAAAWVGWKRSGLTIQFGRKACWA